MGGVGEEDERGAPEGRDLEHQPFGQSVFSIRADLRRSAT